MNSTDLMILIPILFLLFLSITLGIYIYSNRQLLKELKEEKYKLAVASNSIKKTVIKVLENLNIIQLFDLIISNEDVLNAKPHPEMYWNCMSQLKILPKETFIIEDSPVGRIGAKMSGANYLFVNSSDDLNNAFFENILNYNDDMSDLNKYYDKNK